MDFGIKNRAIMVGNIEKFETIEGPDIPNQEISRTHKERRTKGT